MSHAVLRGEPTAAQLHLDTILDDVLEMNRDIHNPVARKRGSVTLSEVLYYSLSATPNDLFMINGTTDERFTNEQILRFAVSIARALETMGAKGQIAVLFVRNHQQMAALYNGLLFAGVIPLWLEPSCTVFEMQHFINTVKPCIIFCDKNSYVKVKNVLNGNTEVAAKAVIANDDAEMARFVQGHSDDPKTYRVARVAPEAPAMMLPTSGSTGLPKAAVLTHQGLVAQLPCMWNSFTKFPTPTKLVKLISTAQWMTHTILMTGCLVYRVPLLMTPAKTTPEHILELHEKYRPTYTLYPPPLGVAVANIATPNQMSSLETMVLTGSALTPDNALAVKSKLSENAFVCNGYGMTEMHSFVALPDINTPKGSNGKILNITEYKIADEDGNKLSHHQTGELCLKSELGVFEAYYNDDGSYEECFSADGWLKTGDLFYVDENEYLFFVARKKFLIKYFNHHISPEEVEGIITKVPGVQESVVCGTSKGAAAAIIVKPGCLVTREQIHEAVSVLSEFKQLRGGIAFVEELPRTHSGKARRVECAQLLDHLLDAGLCY